MQRDKKSWTNRQLVELGESVMKLVHKNYKNAYDQNQNSTAVPCRQTVGTFK